MSVLFILAFSPLAYLQLIPEKGGDVFNWLLALSGLSTLFTWGAICVTHIRFRAAWKVQGHSLEELPFRAFGGVYGSWVGAILVALVLIAQFYIVRRHSPNLSNRKLTYRLSGPLATLKLRTVLRLSSVRPPSPPFICISR